SRADVLPALGACLFLACSGTIAAWAIAGLEQPLVAALLAWAMACCLPSSDVHAIDHGGVRLPGLLFGLLAITRPDGALFGATASCAILLSGRFRRGACRRAAGLFALPALFMAAQSVFRLLYYDDWLPNPAYAKIAPSAEHLWLGWRYVQDGVLYLKGA